MIVFSLLSSLIISVGLTIILILNKKSYYFNGKYKYKDQIEFEVTKIDVIYDSEYKKIIKYTIVASFFNKKGNKDFCYNEFVIFDEVGKYNIGDKFKLSKIEK